ncbi:MAG: UDP-glucose 4-epimerase GalE [Burkholderiales bacterium]|nr:UDP-glucose 4-epimerase GalE [Burkholderiales bacterium]
MSLNYLVVGGAGYIGSHMVKALLQAGHEVVTLDDLSTGHREAVIGGKFIHGSLADESLLDSVFASHRFGAVLHFASFIQVGESVVQPAKYYTNNVSNTLNLLNAMVHHGVRNFVFSSTAAIFGEPQYVPIDERHRVAPINPYGASKAIVEQVLRDYDHAYGLKSICLRYFNACGADPDGELGERHHPETHLIPLALQAASGRGKDLRLFGRDYDTPDGTCIRDYIHIADLCQAHLLALEHLKKSDTSAAFNLGNGTGFSVAEVISAVERVTGVKLRVVESARRNGDPARLVADAVLAKNTLGWKPQYAELDLIIAHAWAWEQKQAAYGNA